MIKYNGNDLFLLEKHEKARKLCKEYNDLDQSNNAKSDLILKSLFSDIGEGVSINKPFICDIGKNITIEDNVFINYNCTILDIAEVTIGKNSLLGPNTSLYTPYHSLDYLSRRRKDGFAEKIVIGKDCWIGGGVIILPGVTIGNGCVIGAGSVVTRSTKAYSLYAGNPAEFKKDLKGEI